MLNEYPILTFVIILVVIYIFSVFIRASNRVISRNELKVLKDNGKCLCGHDTVDFVGDISTNGEAKISLKYKCPVCHKVYGNNVMVSFYDEDYVEFSRVHIKEKGLRVNG